MSNNSIESYLLTHHRTTVIQSLQDIDEKKHYSISINFVELFENDTNLGNGILKTPEKALGELDQKLLNVQDELLAELKDDALQKHSIHARVYGLPACPELHRTVFPKNEDLDLFLQVAGTVVRVTVSKLLEFQREYICSKCKYIQTVGALYDQKYIIIAPKKCTNPENCPGTNVVAMPELNVDNCKDYQEIKIQEQSSKLGVGTMPCSMWVTLEDDLVDICKPGDDVTICGIVKRRWSPFTQGKRIEVELVLKANHIQVNNGHISPSLITPEIREQFSAFWDKYKNCPLEGRDLILKSFCPKLYGMYISKLAVAVVLAGGSLCTEGNEMGIQIRSEPHILLVGDPGTGKSQLLKYAAEVIPRSVLTTGIGTTSAGLTVAAVMEDGQWQLEGGALVLADGGICCIDEFNSMKPHDRTSIHEAMEQQTISVAKASMVCKLRTRCSILAATNPKGGHLDQSQPLSLNLTLPSPLLSRFDLVLMLKDSYDYEWDSLVADHILSSDETIQKQNGDCLWNLETLQHYYTVVKSINPVLTEDANRILGSYYQTQRRHVSRNKARTTMRLLDSLVRLSQAHAKLMFHKEVRIMDALFAVYLIESSMHGECAVLQLGAINVQAPCLDDPMQNYTQTAQAILTRLNLADILEKEMTFLRNDCTLLETPRKLIKSSTKTPRKVNKSNSEEDSGFSETRQPESSSTISSESKTSPNVTGISFDEECLESSTQKEKKLKVDSSNSRRIDRLELNSSNETKFKFIPPRNVRDSFNEEHVEISANKEKKSVGYNQPSFNASNFESNSMEEINTILRNSEVTINSPPLNSTINLKIGSESRDQKDNNTKQSPNLDEAARAVKKFTFMPKKLLHTNGDPSKPNNTAKRKSSETCEEFKKPKQTKVKAKCKDNNLFNLLPSINDDFDPSILDFDDGLSDIPVENNINYFSNKDSEIFNVDKGSSSTDTDNFCEKESEISNYCDNHTSFKFQNFNANTVSNDNKENSFSTENDISTNKEVSFISVLNDDQNKKTPKMKLSQNTKSKLFREKFGFQPKISPDKQQDEVHENITTTNETNKREHCTSTINDAINNSQVCRSIFSSNDEDYDNLDF